MFSLGSLRLIFLLQTGAALEYPELYTHSARMGSDTTIPCQFNVDAIPPARRSFTMLWHFQEKEIFRSPNAPKAADPRLSIDQDRIQDGIADLSMSGVSIADGGLYICSMVQTPEGKVVKEIRLDIHAPPQIIITNKTALINIESVLRCAISGFYPVDIDIKWLRDGVVLDNVIMEIPQRDPNGTYSVNSLVTITPTEEDRKRIFSYRIQHESLTAPLQEDFRLVFEDEERTKQNIIILSVSVAGGVGGVVILIVIFAVIVRKKRGGRRSDKKAENQDTENQKLTCGDESGHVQETRHSINDTNKTSILNQQHEPRKEPNHSQITGTRSAAQWKPSDTTVYTPGNVRGTRDSINDTNKTSIMNPQPEPREEPNHSQMTGTRSAAHRKPSDTTVSTPGDVQKTQQSIRNTNKTFTSNQHPEHREERNQSQTTATRSVIPPKPSYPVSTLGNPSLENQRPERHQTMPEDQETKPSANSQEEETKLSKGNVKNKVAMYENNHISKAKEGWRQQGKVKSKI